MTKHVDFHPRARQRGMATILIVLLAGLSITATTLGVMYTVRSTQDQQMATHASTEAESLAWTGVELLRLYLTKADLDQVEALTLNSNLISGDIGNRISAARVATTANESNVPTGSPERNFAFEVTGKTDLASSTLRVVYSVTGSNGNSTTPSPGVGFDGTMNIYDNLALSGGLTFLGGSNVSLNVEGSVNIGGGVKGVNVMRATGDITVSGGTERIQELFSNGNITLTGGATATLVSALGDITASSGGSQGVLNSNRNITISNGTVEAANSLGNIIVSSGSNQGALTAKGTINISNGGKTATANAAGDVTVTGGSVGIIRTEGNVTSSRDVDQIHANGSVVSGGSNSGIIRAIGNATLNGSGSRDVEVKGSVFVNSGSLSRVRAEKNLTFNGWGSATGIIGGTLSKAEQWNNNVNVTIQPGLAVTLTPVQIALMTPLQPFSLTRPTVDARPLESAANYVFKYVGGKEQITVKNVNGLADGNYRLGKIKKAYTDNWGYLCKETDSSGFCIPECSPITNGNCQGTGIEALKLFCHGQSLQNKCMSYNQGTQTWTLEGSQNNQVIAPGVLWFEGNLTLGDGLYRGTMLATGNINAASGSVSTYATNHAGYANNCQNSLYGTLYPTNYCQNGAFLSNPVGNIALLAGSYNGTEYQGGNISVGSSTRIFGDVIAGNQISGGGGATVQGYITAAGLGSSTSNSLSAGLTIDLRNLPASYTPGEIPDMGGDSGNNGGQGEDNIVKLLWIRPV